MRHDIDDTTLAIVNGLAAKLKRYSVFRDQDAEDIASDLLVYLFEEIREYDETRGKWHRFVSMRLWMKGCDMLRERSTEKAAFFRDNMVSLNQTLNKGDEDGASLCEILGDGAPPVDHSASFQMEYERLLAEMPEELHGVFDRLQTQSQRAVAKDMGMAQSSFRKCYVLPLGRHFASLLREIP